MPWEPGLCTAGAAPWASAPCRPIPWGRPGRSGACQKLGCCVRAPFVFVYVFFPICFGVVSIIVIVLVIILLVVVVVFLVLLLLLVVVLLLLLVPDFGSSNKLQVEGTDDIGRGWTGSREGFGLILVWARSICRFPCFAL